MLYDDEKATNVNKVGDVLSLPNWCYSLDPSWLLRSSFTPAELSPFLLFSPATVQHADVKSYIAARCSSSSLTYDIIRWYSHHSIITKASSSLSSSPCSVFISYTCRIYINNTRSKEAQTKTSKHEYETSPPKKQHLYYIYHIFKKRICFSKWRSMFLLHYHYTIPSVLLFYF